MKAHETKIGAVAVDVAWIKGYLETNGNGAKPVRDGVMVAGGGGVVGGLIILAEKLFGG